MQPDSLSPQPEKQESELSSSQEMTQPESLSVLAETPPEPKPVQEIVKVEPAPITEIKPARRNTATVILGILSFILLVGAVGLGYQASSLNAQLTTTRQQLSSLQEEHTTLQSDYAKLKSDNEKLTTDLNQNKADLDKANADLAAAQADLTRSQDQNQDLNTTLDMAKKKVEVLYAVVTVNSVADYLSIDGLVKATNDKQMLTQWNTFATAPTIEGSTQFLLYVITSVRDVLK